MTRWSCASPTSTPTRRGERALWERATRDSLTGLLNRNEFLGLVRRGLDRRARTGKVLGVIFADLVGFKTVNDLGGHRLGDHVLQTVANVLAETIRPADAIARIGGDEFGVLCEDLSDEREAWQVAQRLRAAVSAIQQVNAPFWSPAVSTGVAVARRDDESAEDLVARADAVMYATRGVGLASHCAAQPSDHLIDLVDRGRGTRERAAPHADRSDVTRSATVIDRLQHVGLDLTQIRSVMDGATPHQLDRITKDLNDLIVDIQRQVFVEPSSEPGHQR